MEVTSPDAFGPERCAAFLAGTEGAPPRRQLLQALNLVDPAAGRRALDVGCGPGRELVALLAAGFDVLGIDCHESMLELARAHVARHAPTHAHALRLECATIESVAERLRAEEFALVHAGFVLPFVPVPRFSRCFSKLIASIAPGGCFSGQFFGANDEFIRTSPRDSMTAHTAADVREILRGFEILEHEEIDRQGSIGKGVPKWWHVHHVIARRPISVAAPPSGPASVEL